MHLLGNRSGGSKLPPNSRSLSRCTHLLWRGDFSHRSTLKHLLERASRYVVSDRAHFGFLVRSYARQSSCAVSDRTAARLRACLPLPSAAASTRRFAAHSSPTSSGRSVTSASCCTPLVAPSVVKKMSSRPRSSFISADRSADRKSVV